jgi:hypothetical protein
MKSDSIPRIFFIQQSSVFFAKPAEFILESLLSMMFGLITNIFPDGFHVHRADAEFAVTGLPRKIGIRRMLLFDPAGGRTFDLLHEFCRSMIFGLREKDVDVIGDGIDFDKGRIVIFEDASDVGMELAAFGVTQQLAAALGTEHEMNDDVGEGLRHESDALTGLGRFVGTSYLALRSWGSLQPKPSHDWLSALATRVHWQQLIV